jgi:hypothetical protein
MRYEMYNPGYAGGNEKEDYDNINVQQMRADLGEFVYDDGHFEKAAGPREARITVILENGARYEGEWLKGT